MRNAVIEINPNKLNGKPVFAVDGFPPVTREQTWLILEKKEVTDRQG